MRPAGSGFLVLADLLAARQNIGQSTFTMQQENRVLLILKPEKLQAWGR